MHDAHALGQVNDVLILREGDSAITSVLPGILSDGSFGSSGLVLLGLHSFIVCMTCMVIVSK